MGAGNRVVLLTVSMVVLAGVLSAGAAFWHTRNLSDSYDAALRIELGEKALAYGQTAVAFLDALGPAAFPILQTLVSDALSDGEERTIRSHSCFPAPDASYSSMTHRMMSA